MTKLWEPWARRAYGAGFNRRTEQHIPEAGLRFVQSRIVVDDLIKILKTRGTE